MNQTRGQISLVFKSEVVACNQYQSPAHRRELIKGWSKLYGKKLNECAIHIIPRTNDARIREDGSNIRHVRIRPKRKLTKFRGINYHRLIA